MLIAALQTVKNIIHFSHIIPVGQKYKSNSLGSFSWTSSHSHTLTLLQWQNSVVTGCKTFKINKRKNVWKALHSEKEKKLNMVCVLSEALQQRKNSWTAMEKHRNEVPTEWVKFTEGVKWKKCGGVWLGFFLCLCVITVFLPRTDYWNDNLIIVDWKKNPKTANKTNKKTQSKTKKQTTTAIW